MNRFFIKYPPILKKLYPNRITRINEEKTIYLTFDDGPIPEITAWVLEQLMQYQAKATFFCIGDNIRKNPDIFQELLRQGHSIGNHSFNHLNGWKSKTDAYVENVLKAEKIILENKIKSRDNGYQNPESGKIALKSLKPKTQNHKLFRPPYGKITNSQARKLVSLGYKIVMWDILSGDFDARTPKEKCYTNVIKNASKGSSIVFHDSIKASKNLKFALPKVLGYYAEKGFSFKAL